MVNVIKFKRTNKYFKACKLTSYNVITINLAMAKQQVQPNYYWKHHHCLM